MEVKTRRNSPFHTTQQKAQKQRHFLAAAAAAAAAITQAVGMKSRHGTIFISTALCLRREAKKRRKNHPRKTNKLEMKRDMERERKNRENPSQICYSFLLLVWRDEKKKKKTQVRYVILSFFWLLILHVSLLFSSLTRRQRRERERVFFFLFERMINVRIATVGGGVDDIVGFLVCRKMQGK